MALRIAQGYWDAVMTMPAVLLNLIPSSDLPDMGMRDYLCLAVWLLGWTVESLGDHRESPSSLQSPSQSDISLL